MGGFSFPVALPLPPHVVFELILEDMHFDDPEWVNRMEGAEGLVPWAEGIRDPLVEGLLELASKAPALEEVHWLPTGRMEDWTPAGGGWPDDEIIAYDSAQWEVIDTKFDKNMDMIIKRKDNDIRIEGGFRKLFDAEFSYDAHDGLFRDGELVHTGYRVKWMP